MMDNDIAQTHYESEQYEIWLNLHPELDPRRAHHDIYCEDGTGWQVLPCDRGCSGYIVEP